MPTQPNSVESFFSSFVRSIFGLRSKITLKESVEEVIEEHEPSSVDDIAYGQRNMLRNVLSFSEMDVEDVMVPRADISAVDYNISKDELKEKFKKEAHTRLPVYRNTLDDIAGFIHIKDLISIVWDNDAPFQMSDIIREAMFVPPSMKTSILLLKMQLSRVHIALVVDEYGGTCGIVTLEDLIEEIIGEIEDEHDKNENTQMLSQISDNIFKVNSRITIEDLGSKLDIKFQDNEDFDTLGGMIFFLLGRVPAIGEVASLEVDNKKLEFEVIDADQRRIKMVVIRLSC